MQKRWTTYSISLWVTGLVILVEGIVSLLSSSIPKFPIGWMYVIFAVVILLVAVIWKGDTHP
ncbi:MAG: hypothetical protein JW967_03460 [Dehalococcoidales bacterium]|nr:hypothetical protein [Dehalococcoidales bacterium]